ncbi:putative nuclease HARBI1 [Hydra vulgaris]|uniref:putative nuclease HARBI1 n=1 Tax=Hydra vulgaris TaxID=6087 RepID=UPI0002B4BA05|nr:putative nuclease HARBI1 [Hydra vulgaris]
MPRLVLMHLVFAEVRRQKIAVRQGLRRKRLFKDRTNPLDIYDDVDLYQRFRFRRSSIFHLENLLKIDLQPKSNQSFCVPSIYQYPTDPHVLNESRVTFYNVAEFPRITGLIDGTHVSIQKPRKYEYVYVNRSSNHSINVQVVCDYNGKFIDIVAKWPGITHDARILRESKLSKKMIDGTLKGLLLSDFGYPCFRWLLTPYLSPTTAAQH